ncbi:MAG TPA: type II secretion system protein [Vicinamibacterales bacterium]|nr:type II secretion system protein [Vicinamibacterales bacterium]
MFSKAQVSTKIRALRNEAGFTLPEVLLAAMIIIIAFVTLLSVIPYSSASVQSGNQLSTATFLANQKLEEAKNVPWGTAPNNDCLGTSANANAAPTVPAGQTCTLGATVIAAGGALPWAADQNSTAITNFNGYSRNVRIVDCSAVGSCFAGLGDPGMRRVIVSVTFQPMTTSSTAASTKTVTLSMIIAQR